MAIQLLFVLFTGLTFGSFVTLASWRLPRDEDIVVKPSRCPQCEAQLGFKDLWPVLSWAASGGKCRHCKAPVSVRYPLTELATAALFLLVYARLGVTAQAALLALLGVGLLVMIVADLEHYIIPDEVHIALVPLGLVYQWLMKTPWEDVAGGFALGVGIGLALHHGYRWIRKKEGLGYGDVKFLAVAGLWLGLLPMIPFLFYAGLLGIINGLLWRALGKGALFPFGPSLAIALFALMFYPQLGDRFYQLAEIIK